MTEVVKAMKNEPEGRKRQIYYETTPGAITGFEKAVRKIVMKMKEEGKLQWLILDKSKTAVEIWCTQRR